MEDADMVCDCEKESYLFKNWNRRVCYLKGSTLYIAKDWIRRPYDSIDLLNGGISLTPKDSCQLVLNIVGKRSKYHKYKFKVDEKLFVDWTMAIQSLISLQLFGPTTQNPSNIPGKYVLVNLVLDWLTLKDCAKIDSALCNNSLRPLMLSLLAEFRSQFSKKFLTFCIELNLKRVQWLIGRNLSARNIRIGSDRHLVIALIRKSAFDFTSLTELVYREDSDLLFHVLRCCINLKRLQLHSVSHDKKLFYSLIVHNRRLERFNWPRMTVKDNLLLLFATHHRCLPVYNYTNCKFKIFRTSVWYQNAPETFCTHSGMRPEHVVEVCKRTQAIESLYDPDVADGMTSLLLETQPNLMKVSLFFAEQQAITIPLLLSICANITNLNLTRRKSQSSLDWSGLQNAAMRLKELSLFMESECILKFTSDILSTCSKLSFSNNIVTDDEMLAIFKTNKSSLTELNVYSGSSLSGCFIPMVGIHCHSLKTLKIHFTTDQFTVDDFSAFAAGGSRVLKYLALPANLLSKEAVHLIPKHFPALHHLFLDFSKYPSGDALKDAKYVLNALGVYMLDLRLEFNKIVMKRELLEYARKYQLNCQL